MGIPSYSQAIEIAKGTLNHTPAQFKAMDDNQRELTKFAFQIIAKADVTNYQKADVKIDKVTINAVEKTWSALRDEVTGIEPKAEANRGIVDEFLHQFERLAKFVQNLLGRISSEELVKLRADYLALVDADAAKIATLDSAADVDGSIEHAKKAVANSRDVALPNMNKKKDYAVLHHFVNTIKRNIDDVIFNNEQANDINILKGTPVVKQSLASALYKFDRSQLAHAPYGAVFKDERPAAEEGQPPIKFGYNVLMKEIATAKENFLRQDMDYVDLREEEANKYERAVENNNNAVEQLTEKKDEDIGNLRAAFNTLLENTAKGVKDADVQDGINEARERIAQPFNVQIQNQRETEANELQVLRDQVAQVRLDLQEQKRLQDAAEQGDKANYDVRIQELTDDIAARELVIQNRVAIVDSAEVQGLIANRDKVILNQLPKATTNLKLAYARNQLEAESTKLGQDIQDVNNKFAEDEGELDYQYAIAKNNIFNEMNSKFDGYFRTHAQAIYDFEVQYDERIKTAVDAVYDAFKVIEQEIKEGDIATDKKDIEKNLAKQKTAEATRAFLATRQ